MNLDVLRYLVETRTGVAELAGDRAASVFKVAEALIASNGDFGLLTLNQFVEYKLLLKVLIEDVPCEGPHFSYRTSWLMAVSAAAVREASSSRTGYYSMLIAAVNSGVRIVERRSFGIERRLLGRIVRHARGR